jgi:hypothetical protein
MIQYMECIYFITGGTRCFHYKNLRGYFDIKAIEFPPVCLLSTFYKPPETIYSQSLRYLEPTQRQGLGQLVGCTGGSCMFIKV